VTSRDTNEEAGMVQREVLRGLGGAARVELAFAMSREAREISLAGIRGRDARLSAEQARRLLLRRILGDELWPAAYGRRSS
jgi:hypothetical protein